MRTASFAPLLVVSLVVIPACSDDVSTPVVASWLEWSDSVTAGVPFGIRVYGEMGQSATSLRVRITVARDTITIQPYSVEPPCRDICALSIHAFDTLVWVPAISASVPRSVTVRTPSGWHQVDRVPIRTFGALTVSPDTVVQPLTRSVGVGSGFQDGLGCSIISHGASRLVSANQSPPWAPGFYGFVYGRVDPVLGSPCALDAPVILVDSIAQ
ncbi:MAG TPA: hypothetical protein VGQ18_15955 [Gemmatimonadales bacterium]|jgi:hypothetical protein|nr:hypothetical protein [Gemmatimonadales bacterium]